MTRFKFAMIGAAALCAISAPTSAAQVAGTLVVDISGFMRIKPGPNASVGCKGTALVVPDTSANPNISQLAAALLMNTGANDSGNIPATIAANGQNFTCQITVPFSFNNIAAGQQIIVVYTVSGNDPGTLTTVYTPGVAIGKTIQVVPVPGIPANGSATYLGLKVVFI
jgi:hypothetical protein